jgi:UDP-N-acetyl-D-mannosaminuronic acid dehydrogenase
MIGAEIADYKEIKLEFKRICVLGLGYIGLPTASTFATNGVEVTGVDVNPQVVQTLRNGGLHIHEPGLRTLVQAAIGSGNLTISDTPAEVDAFIIAVPTPFYEDKRADLRAVEAAARAIVPYLRKGNLVVLESTSPPLTTIEIVAPILETSRLRAGVDFHLAYSPERVLPGQILRELIENARVIGGVNEASAQAGRDLYSVFVRGEIIMTDATTAEMVKLMENTYRDVNIAIANEFSHLAERLGIDVWEAIELANRHPRVKILKPGPGVGGHCISVDPWFLVEAASDITPLIQTARRINDEQPGVVVERVRQILGVGQDERLDGRKVAVLGLAYKANVDDLRESPAVAIVHLLAETGADVIAYEPYKPQAVIAGVRTAPTLQAAVAEAEALLMLVAHDPFKEIDPAQLAGITRARLLLEAVNLPRRERWEQAGFVVHRLGVGAPRQVGQARKGAVPDA